MAFGDIPVRQNGIDQLIEAAWFNTIRTELVNAFGSGGYIAEASLQSLAAGATITLDANAFKPMVPVESTGGAVTLSGTPFGASPGFSGGKEIILVGTDDTNYPVIEHNDASAGFYLNGKIELKKGVMVLVTYVEAIDRFLARLL